MPAAGGATGKLSAYGARYRRHGAITKWPRLAGLAMLVAQLDEELGFDPFSEMEIAVYPRTFADFVGIYQQYQAKLAGG